MASRGERLRLAIIASTVVSGALILLLGVPRAQAFLTPRIERVWVVSAALGDLVASAIPRRALSGEPVTLYAVLQARSRLGGEPTYYGTAPSALLNPQGQPVELAAWSDWWLQPEFLWFKVEPTYPYANETFASSFRAADIPYSDAYQVSWGFGWSHAVDIGPGSDAFPDWDSGTMRFSVRAVVRDHRDRILQQVSAPAAEAVHAPEIVDRPHRVTVTAGNDAFGRMLGFAGLPYVPVATDTPLSDHPVNQYLGGTILDYWVAAQHPTGMLVEAPPDWERLEEIAQVVVDDMFLGADGSYYHSADPRRRVDWNLVQPGDVLAIEDHVGVLFEDRGPGGGGDGVVNRWDRALEAYFEPLRDTALGDAFVADIRVYRLRVPGDR